MSTSRATSGQPSDHSGRERGSDAGPAVQLNWHKRKFTYGSIADMVGPKWAKRAAEGFAATSPPDTSIGLESSKFSALKRLVAFLKVQEKAWPKGAAARVLRDMRSSSPRLEWDTYQHAMNEFCSCLADLNDSRIVASKNNKTRSFIVDCLSDVVRRLARVGCFPKDLTFKHITRSRAYGVKTLTIADLERIHKVGTSKHIPPHQSRTGSAYASAHDHFIQRNVKLLRALEECASRDLLRALRNLQDGDRILADNDQRDPSDLRRKLRDMDRAFAVIRETPPKRRVLELLVCYFAIVPYYRGLRFRRLVAYVGGAEEITSRLHPTSNAFMGAFVIFLVNTGWSEAPALILPSNPFTGEARNGQIRVATVCSVKERAGGKIIEKTLEDRPKYADLNVKTRGKTVSAIRAINIWRALTSKQRADPNVKQNKAYELLWAFRFWPTARPRAPVSHTVWLWMRHFSKRHKDHPLIGGLPITVRHIRRTYQVISGHRNPEDLLRRQLDADHSSSRMTIGYLGVNSLHAFLAAEIRKFQRYLQVAFTSGIKNAPIHLDIPERQFRFLKRLAAKHLGDELFLSSYDGTPEGREKTTKVRTAIKLSLARFVANSDSLEALFLTHRALKESIDRFTSGNVARWIKVWLPFFALIVSLIRKIERSAFARKYRDACLKAEQRLASGVVVLPTIW